MTFGPRWYKRYPELRFFDSDEERERMLEESAKGWPTYSILLLVFIVCISYVLILVLVDRPISELVALFFPKSVGPHIAPYLASITPAVVCYSPIFIYIYLLRKRRRRCLREKLVEKGLPICIECGYDLRGQVDPRCPECGTGFDPKLLKKPPATGSHTPE